MSFQNWIARNDIDIAQKYVADHSISFSTDPEPKKSKTKGIIFTRKPLKFSPVPLILNGNPLPWVEESKYLGNTLVHIPDGFAKDAKQKRAIFMLIGFPHVIADSEQDMPGIKPGTPAL